MINQKRTLSLGILLIASFYAFGAMILLVFLFINPVQAASAIALSHGLPASTGRWILPVIAGLAFLMAFGLYSLSKWGYVLTLVYLLYFGCVNWFLYTGEASWTFLGNGIWSFLVILYLILVRKHFFQKMPTCLFVKTEIDHENKCFTHEWNYSRWDMNIRINKWISIFWMKSCRYSNLAASS